MKAKESVEYWVHQASKGRNVAECWQNIKRINKSLLKEYAKEAMEKVGLLPFKEEDYVKRDDVLNILSELIK